MAVRTRRRNTPAPPDTRLRRFVQAHFPSVLMLAVAGVIMLPYVLPPAVSGVLHVAGSVVSSIPALIGSLFDDGSSIAPLFTREIDYWENDIARWAREYALDPNLLATVMQIESCGHPTISSYAGAQGLFQVMPFHFASTENQLDPNTNAMRGASVLQQCSVFADNDVGLTLACYNGGPSVVQRSYDTWVAQTQRYYVWGTGIYHDAVGNSSSSDTLNRWLAAGGAQLCSMAAAVLGMQ